MRVSNDEISNDMHVIYWLTASGRGLTMKKSVGFKSLILMRDFISCNNLDTYMSMLGAKKWSEI